MKCNMKQCNGDAVFRINRKSYFCQYHFDDLFVGSDSNKKVIWLCEKI